MKRIAATWSLMLLLGFYSVDRWLPLGRWNGQHGWPPHNDQAQLDMWVAAILLMATISFWKRWTPGMLAGTALLGLWTYFHLQTWWIPYLRGVHSESAIMFYSQFQSHTKWLPSYGNHFAPDAEHTAIDVFVFPAFILCVASVFELVTQKRRQGA